MSASFKRKYVDLPRDLGDALKNVAHATGRSEISIIRDAISEKVAALQAQAKPTKGKK